VFEIGPKQGFDDSACDKLIEVFGNPISTLKFFASAAKEGRKLATLQQEGLIQLPAPTTEGITLLGVPAHHRKQYGVVEVQRVKRRSKKKKEE
jgi:hypothetical protein